MRHPFIATIVISAFLMTACGRMDLISQNQKMSEDQAIENLAELPMEQGGYNFRGRKSSLSLAELMKLIEENAPKSGHNAIAGTTDLSGLVQLLSVIQGGKTGIFGVARGMLNANSGSFAATSSKLSSILGIINAVMPVLMVIAPQYGVILQAILTIVPIVLGIISLFKKPTPTPSAWLPGLQPVNA